MIECVPCLAFVGFGLNCLLTALVPSWREKNWRPWQHFGFGNPNAWLVQPGFARPRKPKAERDFDEKSAVLLYYLLAAFFLLFGISGLVAIVYHSVS